MSFELFCFCIVSRKQRKFDCLCVSWVKIFVYFGFRFVCLLFCGVVSRAAEIWLPLRILSKYLRILCLVCLSVYFTSFPCVVSRWQRKFDCLCVFCVFWILGCLSGLSVWVVCLFILSFPCVVSRKQRKFECLCVSWVNVCVWILVCKLVILCLSIVLRLVSSGKFDCMCVSWA